MNLDLFKELARTRFELRVARAEIEVLASEDAIKRDARALAVSNHVARGLALELQAYAIPYRTAEEARSLDWLTYTGPDGIHVTPHDHDHNHEAPTAKEDR